MSLPGNDRADEFLNNSSRSREVERRDLSDVNAASAAADDDSSAIESRICDLQKSLENLISVRTNLTIRCIDCSYTSHPFSPLLQTTFHFREMNGAVNQTRSQVRQTTIKMRQPMQYQI